MLFSWPRLYVLERRVRSRFNKHWLAEKHESRRKCSAHLLLLTSVSAEPGGTSDSDKEGDAEGSWEGQAMVH